MNRVLLTALLVLICTAQMMAQFAVKGEVADSIGEGEAFATIRIFQSGKTDKPVALGTTDADGRFSQKLSTSGKFTLNVTSVGKSPINKDFEVSKAAPTYDFGKLIISEADNTLGEVTVTAQRPLVKTEIDRIAYDVQADGDSKTSTIFEMLKKVPMVTVDGQENIQVKGSSDFKIYKNGRPNSSWSSNPKDVLKSIPASMIKSIEVITEPGAKYDAEGVSGILNIITNDNSSINGVLGSVSAGLGMSWNPNFNTYLTTQFGKITTTINYGYNKFGGSDQEQTRESEFISQLNGNRTTADYTSYSPGYIHYGNIESSYEIDTLNLITLSLGGYYYDINVKDYGTSGLYDKNGVMIHQYKLNSYFPDYQYFDFNGKLDYQHSTSRKGEALTLSYLISTTNQEQDSHTDYFDMINNPLPYTWQKSDSRLHFIEHTFQFDWTRPFAKYHRFETGAKYILRTNDSKTDYTFSDNAYNRHTDFDHTTHVGALYAEYALNTTKWGARAGVRYELSRMDAKYKDGSNPNFGRTLHDVVPTLSASYKIDDANTLKLNFATRVSRPGIAYLNPAVNSNPTYYHTGNPNLKSARYHSTSLTYSLFKPKFMLNSSLNYNFSNDLIQNIRHLEGDVLYSTYDNIGKYRNFSFSNYVQWTVFPKTRFMMNCAITYTNYSNDNQNISNGYWGWFAYANISQELPWKLNVSLYGNRTDFGIRDMYNRGDVLYQYSLSLRRSFLKEDRLTVGASASNFLSGKNMSITHRTIHGDLQGYNCNTFLGRTFYLSVSYRFGSLKAQVKKVAKSINNEDLQGRK